MAKFISINVLDNTNSGVAGASQFGEGEHLINVDKIIEITQTDVSTLTVLLDSPVGAADIITLVASIKDTGAATGAGNIPVTPVGAPLKDALNYSLTANPGGVKSKCILGFDQQTVAGGGANRMYWRSFVQA
jgi:hypothetical protein|tara:strand:- start:675 stop:1070 length:396 start_codon:yes stop_codon:yes gene_type:complete